MAAHVVSLRGQVLRDARDGDDLAEVHAVVVLVRVVRLDPVREEMPGLEVVDVDLPALDHQLRLGEARGLHHPGSHRGDAAGLRLVAVPARVAAAVIEGRAQGLGERREGEGVVPLREARACAGSGRTTIRAIGRAHMTAEGAPPDGHAVPVAGGEVAGREQQPVLLPRRHGPTANRSNGMSMRSMEAFYQSLDVPASHGLSWARPNSKNCANAISKAASATATPNRGYWKYLKERLARCEINT